MLRYVTLCYVMLRYVTLSYVMLRYVTLCYVMLRYVTIMKNEDGKSCSPRRSILPAARRFLLSKCHAVLRYRRTRHCIYGTDVRHCIYGTDVHVTVFMVQTYVTVFTVQTYTSLYLRYRRTRHCIYGTDVRHCIYGTDVHVTIFTYRRKERPRPGRLSRNSPALNSVMRLSVIPTSARRGPKHGECGQKLLRGTFV